MEKPANIKRLDRCARVAFLNELREGRIRAQKNAEDFSNLLIAFERLGSFLSVDQEGKPITNVDQGDSDRNHDKDPKKNKKPKEPSGLGDYKVALAALVCNGSLGGPTLEDGSARFHSTFDVLFESVKDARNSALHEGAKARHLTEHAIELGLLLEEALVAMPPSLTLVRDLMVRAPVIAHSWQPVSFARQAMLVNSFTYLPIYLENRWRLLSDHFIARYLQLADGSNKKRRRLMATNVQTAISGHQELPLPRARCVADTMSVNQLCDMSGDWAPESDCKEYVDGLGAPVLVFDSYRSAQKKEEPHHPDLLVGLVTSFDLL